MINGRYESIVCDKNRACRILTFESDTLNKVSPAEVAELVDALDSGSSGRMAVGVQVPPSAPYFIMLYHNVMNRSDDRSGRFCFSMMMTFLPRFISTKDEAIEGNSCHRANFIIGMVYAFL